ncbi:helix-turn-helix domain-containing protein [Gallaecimonas pentaromativorans]|uniref:helix-turn-helix domain-containing protein n=1 Tax=Gallaecimonas pentaromativorans TaxID=584787 RepID=UPI00067F0E8E
MSAALFVLALRLASTALTPPKGLLALAAHPRLAPALDAIIQDPQKPWTLPVLAELCSMSRATLVRQFQDSLGCSANDFLADIRMTKAASALADPLLSTEKIAELVGYQSVAAFRRAFKNKLGMTPGQWRRTGQAHSQQE